LAASATSASAIGLDRSAQDITAIFEPGGYAELSYGFTQTDLTGSDLLGTPIDDVGGDYGQTALAFKMDFGQGFSFGLILDQPYGSDIEYGGNPATTLLGGTAATLDSRAITAIGRYRFNDNFSVHAGVRQVMLDGETTLKGQAFGPLNGYNVKLENGEGTGWLAGVAYERPLRKHDGGFSPGGLEPGFPDRCCAGYARLRDHPLCGLLPDDPVARTLFLGDGRGEHRRP
jgi:long-subunit fatty acid transport protein